MATAPRQQPDELPCPTLSSGDHMLREEFHRVYEQMPEDVKAELIGGIVYVSSPLKIAHGNHHSRLVALMDAYRAHTPGLELADNASVILSPQDEVQPDVLLRVLPSRGGQSQTTTDDYVLGAPELVAEIALSSFAIDLHTKKDRYAQAGVLEYIVVCLQPKRFHWFDLKTEKEYSADAAGVFKSVLFPGLWLDSQALLNLDYEKSFCVLREGLSTPEHADFVTRLGQR